MGCTRQEKEAELLEGKEIGATENHTGALVVLQKRIFPLFPLFPHRLVCNRAIYQSSATEKKPFLHCFWRFFAKGKHGGFV